MRLSSRLAADRGVSVSVQVECSDKDLHSGVYGGSVHEAMTDLIMLMGKHGFSRCLVTWERSWSSLVSGRPQHLAFATILCGPLSFLCLLLLPSAHCSFERWTCFICASVSLDLSVCH